MQLGFQKVMKEYNIDFKELPSDIQSDIKEIQRLSASVVGIKARGQKPTKIVMDNIKKRDTILIGEIEDYYEDKSENEIENESKEEKEEMSAEQKQNLQEGLEIETELENLLKSGISEIEISEMKGKCPKCYRKIFATYEQNGDNGIKTSRYTIIETKEKPESFKITKR